MKCSICRTRSGAAHYNLMGGEVGAARKCDLAVFCVACRQVVTQLIDAGVVNVHKLETPTAILRALRDRVAQVRGIRGGLPISKKRKKPHSGAKSRSAKKRDRKRAVGRVIRTAKQKRAALRDGFTCDRGTWYRPGCAPQDKSADKVPPTPRPAPRPAPKPTARVIETYGQRDALLKSMGYPSYGVYLASELWASIRGRVVKRDNRRCGLCRGPATQVHHLSYCRSVLTGKDLTQLVMLCRACHLKVEFDVVGSKRSFLKSRGEYTRLLGQARAARQRARHPGLLIFRPAAH